MEPSKQQRRRSGVDETWSPEYLIDDSGSGVHKETLRAYMRHHLAREDTSAAISAGKCIMAVYWAEIAIRKAVKTSRGTKL